MKKHNFKVKYKEKEEVLESIYVLFHYDSSDMTVKFVMCALGFIVLGFMFVYGSHGGNSPSGIAAFVMKYIVAWAAAFIFVMILNRTIWKKALDFTAVGSAEEEYARRIQMNKKEVEAQLLFFEEGFESSTDLKPEGTLYSYKNVVKIIESKRAFGLVVRSEAYAFGGPKNLFGFPKEALVADNVDELKKFLLERCPNVKHGVKNYN